MDKVPMTMQGFAALEEELKHASRWSVRASSRRSPRRAPTAIFRRTPSIMPRRRPRPSTRAAILELESMISRAEVIDVTKLSGDTVKFGATVKLVDEDTEEEKTYQIVGEPEADVRRPHFDHLADRPRPDRQDRRRHGRGLDAGRRQVLRGRRRPLLVALRLAADMSDKSNALLRLARLWRGWRCSSESW